MFIRDKNYIGWKANQMVEHMVENYKKTIKKLEQELHDSRFDVKQLEEQIRAQSGMLRDYERTIDELRRESEIKVNQNHAVRAMRGRVLVLERELREANEKFERSERICKEAVHGYEVVSNQLDAAHRATTQVQRKYDNLLKRHNLQTDNYNHICQELREREDQVDRLLKQLCRRESTKAENDAHWVDSFDLTYFDISPTVRVLFKMCLDVDGNEYIDARKYYNGQPTRKGICLLVEDFQEFLNGGNEAIKIRRRKYAGKGYGKSRQRQF